jgi:hypothetical protein
MYRYFIIKGCKNLTFQVNVHEIMTGPRDVKKQRYKDELQCLLKVYATTACSPVLYNR